MSVWWREWASGVALAPDVIDNGELCLNEAVANIIRHGADHGVPDPIAITLERTTDAVRMIIVDGGERFDPLAHPAPELPRSLDDAPIGGLGIQLLRTFAADVSYRWDDGHNILSLSFTSPPVA